MRLYLLIKISLFSSIIGLIILGGCRSSPDNKLKERYLEKAHSFAFDTIPCYRQSFNMAELTGFEWDTIYMFTERSSAELIREIIGTAAGGYVPENETQIIFTNNGKVQAYFFKEHFFSKEGDSYNIPLWQENILEFENHPDVYWISNKYKKFTAKAEYDRNDTTNLEAIHVGPVENGFFKKEEDDGIHWNY